MAYTDAGTGNAVLGFGTITRGSESWSGLDAAVRMAAVGAWVRLYITTPRPWKASTLVMTLGLKRATDHSMAWDWMRDGSLGDRRTVLSALINTQVQPGESVTWELQQLSAMSWTGLAPVATENPVPFEFPSPGDAFGTAGQAIGGALGDAGETIGSALGGPPWALIGLGILGILLLGGKR